MRETKVIVMGHRGDDRGSFEPLTPEAVVLAAEGALGATLDGTVVSYPSYVNRVYGLRRDDDDGGELIAKFYRPGRWSREAINDEHRYLADCAAAEIPVAAPLDLEQGGSLGEAIVEDEEGGEDSFLFALFPKKGGRNFDAESEDDWLRLGAVMGRCHAVGATRAAPHRATCSPTALTLPFVEGLLAEGLVHPELSEEFARLCRETLGLVVPLFEKRRFMRIHGDCHRGNILDRPGEGLLIIDFDDMMTGPAVQDLWLLLPDHASSCRRELALLVEGYEDFAPFDRGELALIEPLRFMRMVYFLAWRSRQRNDLWFKQSYPDWGNEAFWIKELEDLGEQAALIRDSLASTEATN